MMSTKDLMWLNSVNIPNAPEVIYCAREQLTRATRFGPVIRRFFVVECNESGHGAVIINGTEHSFGPKQCYVLLPGDTVTHISDGDDPRSGIYCILDAPMLALQFKEAGITSQTPFIPDQMFPQVQQWLERMLGQASLSYAGAVGAKLLYPDSDLIQHTGVINIMNGPSHALCGYSDKDMCAFARNIMDFNYLAVTAACLMISKEKFYEIGAFDESMAVSYNDVELCFRLVKKGYFNVVRNDAILYHYESYSRGYDAVSGRYHCGSFTLPSGPDGFHPDLY